MKNKILFPLLFIVGLSIGACSSSGSSLNSGSSDLDSSSNNQRSSSSGMSFPSYSSSFEEKETGLSLDQITEEISKIDPQPEERKRVRYTWHIVEKLTGTYPKAMLDSTQMPEGEIVGDFVSEPRNNNLDTNIQLISGTPVTQMQQY